MTSAQSGNSTDGITTSEHDTDTRTEGVGARQPRDRTAGWGGRYLDVCTKKSRAAYGAMTRDPRLDDLQAIGLNDMWLEIADTFGVDQFLGMWEVMTRYMESSDPRVRVPNLYRFFKLQRDRFIVTLREEKKLSGPEIRQKLKEVLCEDISVRHIDRVLKKHNIEL